MAFNSVEFLILLGVTLGCYYAPPFRRQQIRVLLAASLVFYAWESPRLLALLVGCILVNAVLSHRLAGSRASRVAVLAGAGIAFNVLVIAFFKYGPLAAGLLMGPAWASVREFLVGLPLPIGISFYTFENISLLVDVVRGRRSGWPGWVAPRLGAHLERTGLFVAFFPHLISGPILRAEDFFSQISGKRWGEVEWGTVHRYGVGGLFLKMVVADQLKDATAQLAYPAFLQFHPVTLLALLWGYSLQIFADFAGYSWLALALGALLGYRLPQNFHYPYTAESLADFWRRWHISLSSWLRDYLYFPMGGSRRGPFRTYLHLFLVMAIGGLWHGAAWSYAVWGLYHGVGLALERAWNEHAPARGAGVPLTLRRLGVFGFVTFGWLLFKLVDFRDVLSYLGALGTNWTLGFAGQRRLLFSVGVFSLPVVVLHVARLNARWWASVRRRESDILGVLLAGILLQAGLPGRFIYFQF